MTIEISVGMLVGVVVGCAIVVGVIGFLIGFGQGGDQQYDDQRRMRLRIGQKLLDSNLLLAPAGCDLNLMYWRCEESDISLSIEEIEREMQWRSRRIKTLEKVLTLLSDDILFHVYQTGKTESALARIAIDRLRQAFHYSPISWHEHWDVLAPVAATLMKEHANPRRKTRLGGDWVRTIYQTFYDHNPGATQETAEA